MPSDNTISISSGGEMAVGKCYTSKLELRRDLALIVVKGYFKTIVSRSTTQGLKHDVPNKLAIGNSRQGVFLECKARTEL